MSVPTEWFTRNQRPEIPNETVYVSSDGSYTFPEDMATDHIVNALNKQLREKQKEYRASAAAMAFTDRERAQFYMEVADDTEYLRMELLTAKPVLREMEMVVAQRQEALNGAAS